MKWPTASISLLVVTLLVPVAVAVAKYLPTGSGLFTQDFIKATLQLGYYDLLARQREIYDTQFDGKGNTVLLTLTSPNDNRFMAKVSLEKQSQNAEGVMFTFHKIYYSDDGQMRMIKNILGYAENNSVRFDTLRLGRERLMITPSGQMLRYR
ncbi:hypothetical protein [Erwinia persicina]|uniref:hypothetical protein n=1 Tax=Erwinia persicina TaxID=55211 RepID=UPI0017857A68|nr:hypothetical protein [Erwinia persicina]MBD8162785.1 hypothetical protein [Erwinia persicina]MBD8214572.1 hypothetical protein [Erwinia persicina]